MAYMPYNVFEVIDMFSVEYYEKSNGESPVKDYLFSLNNKMQAKTLRDIELLADKGNSLRMPYSEYIQDGLYELRTISGNDIGRIFYFFQKNKIIILTNGYVKKAQKASRKEIEIATQYKNDYLAKHKEKGEHKK